MNTEPVAWAPYSSEERADNVRRAVQWVEQASTFRRGRALLITDVLYDLDDPVLQRFAQRHDRTTIRSSMRTDVLRSSTVLAYHPDHRTLEIARRLAGGAGLCVVEGPHIGFSGWAIAAQALNLTTSKQTAPADEYTARAIADLRWEGNNGWADTPGASAAIRILQALQKRNLLDSEQILGAMLYHGKSANALKTLAKLIAKVQRSTTGRAPKAPSPVPDRPSVLGVTSRNW